MISPGAPWQLQAANEELERWSDAIERLAGGVAHELNNKLAVILGFNSWVSQELGDRHPLQRQLGEVRIAAEHSAALTKDLLAFAGRQMLERQPIPAGQIAHDLRRLLEPALGTGIELVIEDSSGGAIVLGDLAQLQHALLYLALNARDAMPDGGRLTIRTAITDPPVTDRAHAADSLDRDLRHRHRNLRRGPSADL